MRPGTPAAGPEWNPGRAATFDRSTRILRVSRWEASTRLKKIRIGYGAVTRGSGTSGPFPA
jgi:hypothetical protein